MPCGIVRTDSNNGGQSFRNGTPITEPHDFGNEVDWQTPDPAHFGNPVPPTDPTFNSNPVTWPTPNPAHFGNDVTLPTLSAPTFDPPAGEYDTPQTVTIMSDSNAGVTYYTTDGTTPSPMNGTQYAGPFTVAVSETIKAVSYTPEYAPSPVGSVTYTIVGAVITLVVSTAATNDGSFAGTQTTSPIDTTGANFLIACCDQGFGGSALSMSDSFGNTWEPLPAAQASGCPQLFYCYAPTVGTGHTFTATASGDDVSIAVAAFSGLNDTSSVYEVGSITNSAVSPGGTTQQAGDITPATAGDLIINGLGWWKTNAAPTPSIDSGFTVLDLTGIGNFSNAVLAYLVAPTTATVNPTWTLSLAVQGSFAATGAAFAQA